MLFLAGAFASEIVHHKNAAKKNAEELERALSGQGKELTRSLDLLHPEDRQDIQPNFFDFDEVKEQVDSNAAAIELLDTAVGAVEETVDVFTEAFNDLNETATEFIQNFRELDATVSQFDGRITNNLNESTFLFSKASCL